MILVDTSVWIEVLKDKTGHAVRTFHKRTRSENYVLSRFNQLELLQGAKNEKELELLDEYLTTQYYLETSDITWQQAGRIYFELRRRGITINSPIDCCIAQVALECDAVLLHRDKDFEKIARIRPLELEFFRLD